MLLQALLGPGGGHQGPEEPPGAEEPPAPEAEEQAQEDPEEAGVEGGGSMEARMGSSVLDTKVN